jgi:hypothetical protein
MVYYPVHVGAVVVAWEMDLQLIMQSVPITTKVVILNPTHGEVYSIQHYVIQIVNDLRQVDGFHRVLWFPPPIKLTATI